MNPIGQLDAGSQPPNGFETPLTERVEPTMANLGSGNQGNCCWITSRFVEAGLLDRYAALCRCSLTLERASPFRGRRCQLSGIGRAHRYGRDDGAKLSDQNGGRERTGDILTSAINCRHTCWSEYGRDLTVPEARRVAYSDRVVSAYHPTPSNVVESFAMDWAKRKLSEISSPTWPNSRVMWIHQAVTSVTRALRAETSSIPASSATAAALVKKYR